MHTTFPRTRWDNPLRPKAYAPFQGHTYIAAHLPYTRTARGNTLTSKPSHPGRQGFLLSLRGQWNTPRPGAPSISASGSRPNVPPHPATRTRDGRSEEHTSELQSLMRISYAVFCLKKKNKDKKDPPKQTTTTYEINLHTHT